MTNRWETKKLPNFAGYLAIASPALDHSDFARAVLLLMQHNEQGGFGVVLNRPANEQIYRAWAELTGEPKSSNDPAARADAETLLPETAWPTEPLAEHLPSALPGSPPMPASADDFPPQPGANQGPRPKPHLSLGGPLAGPVFALHRRAELGEQQVQAGLYFSASKERLVKLAHEEAGPYRIFFGAAGWGPGQLELEVERGIWHMLPATDDVIFCDPDHQWDLAIRRFGRYLWEELGVRGFPAQSEAN